MRIGGGWPVRDRETKPAGFDPRDPADPNYDFTRLDRAVTEAEQRGIIPLLSITGAPEWAEGPGRPSDAPSARGSPTPARSAIWPSRWPRATRAASKACRG